MKRLILHDSFPLKDVRKGVFSFEKFYNKDLATVERDVNLCLPMKRFAVIAASPFSYEKAQKNTSTIK